MLAQLGFKNVRLLSLPLYIKVYYEYDFASPYFG